MPSILIKPTAENDLINIWLYIARDNPEPADRVYQAAEKTFETLGTTFTIIQKAIDFDFEGVS